MVLRVQVVEVQVLKYLFLIVVVLMILSCGDVVLGLELMFGMVVLLEIVLVENGIVMFEDFVLFVVLEFEMFLLFEEFVLIDFELMLMEVFFFVVLVFDVVFLEVFFDEFSCRLFVFFDISEDGVFFGVDCLWCYFYLQIDFLKNDGVVSFFDFDICLVVFDVEIYGVKGDVEGYVQCILKYCFQIIGRVLCKVCDGFLVVDVSGLVCNGIVCLFNVVGFELEGIQVFEDGQIFVFVSGECVVLFCC